MILYSTASPILHLRDWIITKVKYDIVKDIVACVQCSSFWLALIIWFVFPFLPDVFIFGVNMCALVTIASILNYKYL